MTGFIRGLFGGGKKKQQSSGAFYLEPDEAKTLGDIDFMRQSKVIKRTYAKKAGETEEKEVSTQVSSMSKAEVAETRGVTPSSTGSFGTTSSSSFGTASSSSFGTASSSSETSRRRNSGSSDMDLFRKMAKDVKKR